MVYTHEMLCDARRALHELMIGRAVVSVSKDGRQVQYSRETIGELRQYIEELENQGYEDAQELVDTFTE